MNPIPGGGGITDFAVAKRWEALPMATDSQASQARDLIDRLVRYKLDLGDRIVVIENVPARVCEQTGEEFFSPETAERIWQLVHGGGRPARAMHVDVYDYR
jgi:YgiT-type zinc finger domain-containing protein